MRRRLLLAIAIAAAGLAGCTVTKSGAEAGKGVFDSSDGISPSTINVYSCATCHTTDGAPDPKIIRAGLDLQGVTKRTGYWGLTADGTPRVKRLEDAVDQCFTFFMAGRATGIDPTSEEAKELFEYLESISPDGSDPTPKTYTVIENITAPALTGDKANGAVVWKQACANCHGDIHTGNGQILKKKITLPEYTQSYDQIFPGTPHGLVVIEKIRHGRFFKTGGTMPLFSPEILTDQDIMDILAYLELQAS